jgi:choline kinase
MSGKAIRNVETIYTPYRRKKYSIIIPAAGEGVRMRSFGPKSLIKINSQETLLDRQISVLRSTFATSEIILVAGFEADRIFKKYKTSNILCIENENYATSNVARSIGMGLRAATADIVLVVYGDLFLTPNALKLPLRNQSAIVTCNTMKPEEVGCTIKANNKLEHMHYDLNPKWAQVALFTERELALLKHITWKRSNDKMFGFEVINLMIANGANIKTIPAKQESILYDVDSSRDLQYVRNGCKQ